MKATTRVAAYAGLAVATVAASHAAAVVGMTWHLLRKYRGRGLADGPRVRDNLPEYLYRARPRIIPGDAVAPKGAIVWDCSPSPA